MTSVLFKGVVPVLEVKPTKDSRLFVCLHRNWEDLMSVRANNIVSSSTVTESINTRIWYTKYALIMLPSPKSRNQLFEAWAQGIWLRYKSHPSGPIRLKKICATQSRMYLQVVFDRKLLAVLSQKLFILKNVIVNIFEFWSGLVLEVSINISLTQVVRFGSKFLCNSILDVSSSCFWPKIASGPESKVVYFEKPWFWMSFKTRIFENWYWAFN